MYDSFLVPVGPELSSNTAALDEAAELATELGSSITLLYVWLNDEEKEEHEAEDKRPEPIQHALYYLGENQSGFGRDFGESFGGVTDFDVDTRMVSGDTADAIVDTAENSDVDAICMGTNAATGVKRMVLGSVTGETIRKTKLPVIAVNYHGDENDE